MIGDFSKMLFHVFYVEHIELTLILSPICVEVSVLFNVASGLESI